MEIQLNHCFLTVDDFEAALAFYRDTVGLEVKTDATMGDFRWLTLAGAGQDVEIGLQSMPPYPDVSDADTEALRGLLAKGLLGALIFRTDDLDATFERVRAAGYEVLQEPFEQPYGVRDCAFRDPAGNMVRFNQPST
ncbi:MAG: VOC family protein [Propionibacteriales bacterium]|nr:VOC family protein [Propionibacteriales bacterium]